MKSNSSSSIIAEYEDVIEEMTSHRPLPELDIRNKMITQINEDFYTATEQNLPSYLLTKLADWYMVETLNDRDVDKVTNNHFPILSHRQLRRRIRRENIVEGSIMDYLNLKFVARTDSLSRKTNRETE